MLAILSPICSATLREGGADTHVLVPNLTPCAAGPSRRHLMKKRDQPCNICHEHSKYITDNLLSNISDQLP